MVQWFLFNRIDAKPAAPTIGRERHPIAHALPNETKSALSFVELAKSRTKAALDAAVREHHPPASRVIGLRQLCDHLPAISLKNSGMQRRKNDGIYSISKKRLANLFHSFHRSICTDSKKMNQRESAKICGSN
jgi:hypothetical protein